MNDPPRWRSPDGFDDDAIFADIVAHMNDDVTETELAARPGADHAASDAESTDIETTNTKTDSGTGADADADADAEGSAAESTSEAKLPKDHTQADHTQADHTKADHTKPDHTKADDTRDGDADQDLINQPSGLAQAPGDPQAVSPPQVWRAHEVDDTYEDHFDPPPVSPLPVGDLQFWAIIAGMAGGPLLLLYLVFFNRDASGYWILAAIAMSVGGFALLVSRMPRHHDDDDDGARL